MASIAEQLGYAADARLVVVHVDDVGMAPPATAGALQALEATATCGSIMVPCPGFDAAAQLARGRPELDLGVHLTLNAEWPELRWGPVADDVPGLCAPDGSLWPSTEETVAHAGAEEVARELRAQIERALAAGIDVTHLDAHMGTAFASPFAPVYLEVAREYRLPAFAPRPEAAVGMVDAATLEGYRALASFHEAAGQPLFDAFDANSLGFTPGEGFAHNRARVAGLGPGLAYLITHCAQGGPELAAFAPDWRQRDEERQLYSDGRMDRVLREAGCERIGMRPLRDLLRG